METYGLRERKPHKHERMITGGRNQRKHNYVNTQERKKRDTDSVYVMEGRLIERDDGSLKGEDTQA